ncbi:pyridoxamine 5'-phosphate oxidase [Maricurvus nonylphenolicus]|uniref:pyridoxine/pyridoxamine 5'-phosphate oxidase n=1 Tax=Maricurvus nonylphenolicus TaxID=1008307 RepID=UPI0036F38302
MSNPIEIFKENWQKAKALNDANGSYCTLATVSPEGAPSMRTLVLRKVTDDAFVIFINSSSVKWQHLEHSKQTELLVFWPSLLQQYRIRGEVIEISEEEMQSHWQAKPYASKIIDHYYTEHHAQTSVLPSRAELLEGVSELQQKFPQGSDIPFAQNAKGIMLKASYMEVWENSEQDRLHQRTLYTLNNGGWSAQTLVP